jgi:hypothetical protein
VIASNTQIGSANPPTSNPAKIATSAILSNTESRNPPFFDTLLVYLATWPSTMSKNPETKSNTPPIIVTENQGEMYAFSPYAIADKNANPKPTAVQKLGDSPVAPNLAPSFSSVGLRESRKLFSNVVM